MKASPDHIATSGGMTPLASVDTLALQTEVFAILTQQSTPLKEYDLMVELTERGFSGFSEFGSDSYELFRAHFVLFHALYSLRNHLIETGGPYLEISVLRIGFLAGATEVSSALSLESDSIASYYLDWKNLHETSREDVEEMLESFWEKFTGLDSRADALSVMDLEPSATPAEIKQRYRELAFEHHPDKGGDPEVFKKISSAMKTLQG